MTSPAVEHEHLFPEEQEPNGRLILAPCLTCNVSALDAMDTVRNERDCARGLRTVTVHGRGGGDEDLEDYADTPEYEVPDRLMFHWSPASRRKQINRFGLRPSMTASMSIAWKAPYVCFADSPSWAWALSGQMGWAPEGEWDLWQTWLSDLGADIEVIPDPTRQSGMYEVRTPARIFKRDLWHVGSRTKSP